MHRDQSPAWTRLRECCREYPSIGSAIELSRVGFPTGSIGALAEMMRKAFRNAVAIESGELADVDEDPMVGHDRPRQPQKAPSTEITDRMALPEGAGLSDEIMRSAHVDRRSALMLVISWFYIVNVSGSKDMVILPHNDHLEHFASYLQPLVMESSGQKLDLRAGVVHQALTANGNRGASHQHAYVKQLIRWIDSSCFTFLEVLNERTTRAVGARDEVACGGALSGFLLGTRESIPDGQRQSITPSILDVSAFHLGVSIALLERAANPYAIVVHINAAHESSVESGKAVASQILDVGRRAVANLRFAPGAEMALHQLRACLDCMERHDMGFRVRGHLAAHSNRTPVQGSGREWTTRTHPHNGL